MNRAIVMIIPAGDATALFPVIAPAAAPDLDGSPGMLDGSGGTVDPPGVINSKPALSLAPDTGPGIAERELGATAAAASSSPGMHVLTAGLAVIALALMLVTTRLSARRRTRTPGRRGP
jgi:hypothetical protein